MLMKTTRKTLYSSLEIFAIKYILDIKKKLKQSSFAMKNRALMVQMKFGLQRSVAES